MKTRKLRDLTVSPIGMGCMAMSHGYGEAPGEYYVLDAIRKAYEYGCTFFDTAEGYGVQQCYPGHNEQLLGKAVDGFRDGISHCQKGACGIADWISHERPAQGIFR